MFLTDQIGPGTTAASNEIASDTSTVLIANSSVSGPLAVNQQNLLSLSSLAAGTYYLTIAEVESDGFPRIVSEYDAQTVTFMGAGVTAVDSKFSYGGSPASYLPASPMNDEQDFSYWFAATGDPAESSVPEPSTLLMLVSGIAVFAAAKRK